MVNTEKIHQTMNSWQWGELIAVCRKKKSGVSSRPTVAYVTSDRHIAEDQVYLWFSPGHLWLHEKRLPKVDMFTGYNF